MHTHSPVDELSLVERTLKTILDGTGKVIPGIPSLVCTEPGHPSTAVLLDVPGLCQVSSYTCGITSSWSIITALGYRVPLKEWFQRCHKAGCHPDEGMSIDQISKALKLLRLKVVTKRYRGRNQVSKLVDEGQPILFGQGATCSRMATIGCISTATRPVMSMSATWSIQHIPSSQKKLGLGDASRTRNSIRRSFT